MRLWWGMFGPLPFSGMSHSVFCLSPVTLCVFYFAPTCIFQCSLSLSLRGLCLTSYLASCRRKWTEDWQEAAGPLEELCGTSIRSE